MPQPHHPCPQCGDSQWQLVESGWQCRKCLTTIAAGETALLPPHLAGNTAAVTPQQTSPNTVPHQSAAPTAVPPPPPAAIVPPHLAKSQSPPTPTTATVNAPVASVIPPHLKKQENAPAPVAKPSHVPPHLQAANRDNKAPKIRPATTASVAARPSTGSTTSQPSSHQPTTPQPTTPQRRSSSLFAWILLGGGTFGGIAVLIGGIFLTLYAIEFNQKKSNSPTKREPAARVSGKGTWQDSTGNSLPVYNAPDHRVRMRGVEVGVAYLETGQMLVKDDNNRVTQAGPNDLLHVFLVLQNETGQPQPYQPWWSGEFTIDDQPQRATLIDNLGNVYKQYPTPASGGIRGQFRGNEVPPHERREDVIVFEGSKDIDDVDFFELTLPSAAFGGRGQHRFRIPAKMLTTGSGAIGPVAPNLESMDTMRNNTDDAE